MGKEGLMTKTLKAIETEAKIDKWDLIKEFLDHKRNYQQGKQRTYRMGENICKFMQIVCVYSRAIAFPGDGSWGYPELMWIESFFDERVLGTYTAGPRTQFHMHSC